jgi:REP element-mobilizing transposase RayT
MRIPRKYIIGPGDTFHKIWRCHDGQFLLQKHRDKHAYLQAIHDDYLTRCSRDDFALQQYCVMSNHVHEENQLKTSQVAFSRHMQRAHGGLGLRYNRRHERKGKVALARPKTLRIQNDGKAMRCAFYIVCNPVRAGIAKHPTDIRWKEFSSCRFYAYGEKNRYSDMLEQPEWYLRFGNSAPQRQHKYRSLLDKYQIEEGLKRDPKMSSGHFIGGPNWVLEMRRALREQLRKQDEDPPP